MKERYEIREVTWRQNKATIEQLTLDALKRRFPSTVRAQRPAQALSTLDEGPETRHLAAFTPEGEVIGTVRLHPLSAESSLRRYRLDGLPDWLRAGEVTGLAVAASHRDTPVPVELITEAYKRARSLGCQVIVTLTFPDLVMMYEAFGFFRYDAGFQDPDQGFVIPMMLNLHDVAYMRLVGSPLTRLAQRYFNPDRHGLLLLERFADVVLETRPPRSRGRSFPRRPTTTGPLPPVRPPERSIERLDLGPLIAHVGQDVRQGLPAGAPVVSPDRPSDDVYVIVSGTLGVHLDDEHVPVMYLREGDVVAETAFGAAGERLLSVRALSECVILRLSPTDLERLAETDPTYAARLLLAMFTGLAERFGRHISQWRKSQKPGPLTTRWRRELAQQVAKRGERPGIFAASGLDLPEPEPPRGDGSEP